MNDNVVDFTAAKAKLDDAAAKVKAQFEELEPRLKKLPQYRGSVPSKTWLRNNASGIKRGECFWVEADNSLFTVVKVDKKGIQLRPLDMNATISTGYTMYEMNQTMVAQEPLFDWTDNTMLNELKRQLADYLYKQKNSFYLMYGRESHYFTIFNVTEPTGDCMREPGDALLYGIKDCIEPIWNVVSIDVDMSDESFPRVEVWARDANAVEGNPLQNHMLYLFPYDQGVYNIECHK